MKTKQTIIHPLVLCTGLFLLAGAGALKAGNDTWDGLGADNNWNTAGNWTTGSANRPPASSDALLFDGSTSLTANNNDTAAETFAGITFNSTAGAFTLTGNSITSSAGFTDKSASLETINLPVIWTSGHSMNIASGGSLTINGLISGAGTYTLSKTSGGLLTLTGEAGGANTFGPTTVSAGTLLLDFTQGGSTPAANIVPADALTLGGGTLQINGSSSGASSQTFASTTLSAGASTISAAPVSGVNYPTVALKALASPAGSTLVLNGPAYSSAATTASGETGSVGNGDPSTGLQVATAVFTTTTAEANTVLQSTNSGTSDYSDFAVVGLYDFAAVSGSTPFTIVGLSQLSGGTGNDGGYYLATTAFDTSGAEAENHYDDIAGSFTVAASTTGLGGYRFNYNGPVTVTIPGGTTYTTAGILMTPNVGANNDTIAQAAGTAGAFFEPGFRSTSNGGSLAIYQNDANGFLIMSINLVDGKTAGSTWSQNGPGTVVLSGTNTTTGAWYLNGGATEIVTDNGLGAPATAATANMNGGTILGAATFTLDNSGANKRPVALGNNGGGLAAVSGNTMTVDGVVSGSGILVAGIPASSANGNVVGQVSGTGTGTANAAVSATGTVILSGVNTYTGNTVVDSGTLALASGGTISTTPQIYTAPGAIFDVSAAPGFTLGASQSIAGSGTNNGSVNTSAGSIIYAGTDGGYGTNTFNNNLTNVAAALFALDVSTVHNGNNDLINVGGTLALNGTSFQLKAPSSSVNLDTTADYVLVKAGSIVGSPNSAPVWVIPPANAANFIVITNASSQVVLHYSASVPPSASGFATPSSVTRNQSTLITVLATPGSTPIASVVLNASQIGGSSALSLVESNTSTVYTNTVTVTAGTTVGAYILPATATDTSSPTPLTATANIALTVLSTQQVWDGAGANNNWSAGLNWASGFSPGTGDFATFAGTTRLTPSMDSSYNLVGVAFSSTAGNFILGTPGSTLTLGADGITNNSANLETVNTPIVLSAAETLNAASGMLTVSQPIDNGGNLLSIDGSFTNTISSAISDSGGLAKNGSGTNILSGNNSYGGATTINAGSLVLSGNNSLAGAVTINSGGSTYLTVNGGTSALTTMAMNSASVSLGFLLAGGTVNFSGNVSFSSDNGNGGNNLQILGGVFNAASLTSGRSSLSLTGGAPTSGQSTTGGIHVNTGATVNITNTLGIGGASSSANSSTSMRMDGGTVNVGGTTRITINNASRWSLLDVNGGLFNSTDSTGAGIQIGGGYAGASAELLIRAGTVSADTITFGDAATQTSGTNLLSFTGGVLYIGSGGIIQANASPAYLNTIKLGTVTIGSLANWACPLPMTMTGTTTFQAADGSNNPYNIDLGGTLSGSAVLNKTGGGTLSLDSADTYTGNTLINNGSLILTASGSVTSPNIYLASGTTFDVSQVGGGGGFTLNGNQTIYGFGTVNGVVGTVSGATIYPGSNTLTGTLTFPSGLNENGGVVNEFTLSSNPSGPNNDFINAAGGALTGSLNLSGVNTISIIGAVTSGGIYPLFSYGTLSGDVIDNLTLVGATGYLSNSVTANEIFFVAQATTRGPTNTVWVGNPSDTDWDTEATTNWLNAGKLDYFISGDNVHFTDVGAGNANINLTATELPGSVTVNTTGSYTFSGSGWIGGSSSLIVSNGGLTVQTANTYTGPTILDGGVLTTANIANSGSPSGIGAATADPGNLIFNGGTFSYNGGSAGTDHGITLTNGGGMIDVAGGSALNLNGVMTGPGGLTLIDSGTLTLTAGNTYTGNTTISNGTLTLQNATAAGTGAIVFASGTLDMALSGQPTYANNLTVTANSTLDSAGGNNNIVSGAWTGSNSVTLNMQLSSAGTFSVNGNMTNFYGTVELGANTGFFRFNAGGGDTMFGAPNATIDTGTSSATLEARNPDTIAVGALEGGSSTFLKGPTSTAGTLIWQIGANTNNPSTTFYGTIAAVGPANEIEGLSKVGNGTLTLAGQNTYAGTTTVNNGVLALINNPNTGNDGSINNSATISLVSGTVIDVSGRSDSTLPLGSAQVLTGTGTIRGSLDAHGTVEPGVGIGSGGTIGTLIVTNNLTLESSSTNWFKINRGSSPNSDQMVVSNSVTFNSGTLDVTNIGAALQAGDTFKLFNNPAASYSGSFGTLVLPALTGSLAWNTNNLSVNGTISVVSLAPPGISSVNFSGLAGGTIVLNATNGPINTAVQVLTTTNLTLPVAQWPTNSTTTFDGSGNLTGYSITVNPHAPQLFILLRAQ